jgi:2',3'-cyclic-nucleotide 2'-phosphodiesterase (5'-nucleotidase family)
MDITKTAGPIVPEAQPRRIRILHTNDVHGAISPLPDEVVLGRPAELGGSAYTATLVDQARRQDPGRTLLLDAGDVVHGQAATDLDRGESMMEIMGEVGYDAATLGNHDFHWGVGNMLERLAQARHPVVIANVVMEDGSPVPNTRPHKIFDMDGVKVGVTGLLTAQTATEQRKDRIEGVRFLDEATALRQSLQAMREEGAEVVVVLSHMGLDDDRKLARQFPGQGLVILGGHSHDRLTGPERLDGNYVVQAGSMGKEVGEMVLSLERRSIVGVEHRLIPVDPASVAPDPEVATLVARYEERAEREMGKVLTELPERMGRSERIDSPVGNLVTDSMRHAAGTQVAFINSDALRRDLEAGPLTRRDLYEMMPFGSEVMRGELTGQQILAALEHSIANRSLSPQVHTPFLQVSGMRFAYDAAMPAGQRVLAAEVDGRPLEAEATYSVALDDYLCLGKMGYDSFAQAEWQPTGVEMLEAMATWASRGLPAPGPRRIDDRTEIGAHRTPVQS